MYVAAFFITILLIWMDALDGYVARKRNDVQSRRGHRHPR